ncbi:MULTISPECIES: TCR/Tet family MFS transporter [unclassified Hyphomonas]|jgi:DHA1 family tetracycline resistance protein-like MFS transporter|uniref:Tetracycline efflux protein TetA n=1 Tax=hydrothermal vent metagenome TaxID=652676 RepID=A0A160U1I0_9ZZZZ|nr:MULTISPECIES: TCR/Tet family MFS transporter [unclassified Hyphomonas]MAN92398.1 tetracycline resistance MFS efflux pump [Hyphomonadaceae bacterium]MAA84075.1 tetracycline resistance MFS efflux pump [Hyphomonas sp.]MAL47529.1 tetracycline resistance MFS efflux pump [Hyphomonas sp.]MAX84903.1 tetracycline resistance MFS efflux pump [Hyphomonas sp.]RCL85060.1 MAG: MFS transporter [Hyphomonas sp.]|tara:strand:+ start:9544 stop:10797 length:1254 start_codon:yes stop_codon:yes gene_type:complete
MTDSAPATRRHGKNAFMFVIITVAIDMLAFGLIIPVVPTLVQELGNISAERATLYIGGLGTTYAFMNFLFGPMLGALSDRFGRRPVLLASIATLSIDFLIMGFANSIWLLFLGRALSGISGATYSTANAYIADVTEPENRGKAFGMVGAAFGFGFIFGPVMGGILGEFDPRAPFFAAAALALLNFCYGFFVLPESLEEEHRRPFVPSRSNPFGAVKHFSKLPHVSWFLVSAGVFFLAHTVYPSTWPIHGEIRYDWSPKEIGLSLGLVGLGAAVVQAGLIGIALKRFGAVRTALYGIIINALALFAYAFAGLGWVVFLIIPLGALGGVASPTLNSLMSTVTPKNAQGELQGASASLNSFAMIFGPMIMAGALFYFTEPGTPLHFPGAAFLLAGILTAFSIIPFLRGVEANKEKLPIDE